MRTNYYTKEMRYTDPYMIRVELEAIMETLDIVTESLVADLNAIRKFAEGTGVSCLVSNVEKQHVPILCMLLRNLSNLAEETEELEKYQAKELK